MASYDGSIMIETKVDTGGITKGTRSLKGQVAALAAEYRKLGMSQSAAMKKAWKELGTTSKSLGGLMASLGAFGKLIASAFAVKVLYDFGKQAISLASDLQEVQNVVDVAFGDMADKVEEFAKTSIETMGISELTAKRTASTYMAMGKGMGLAAQDAFNMSLGLTQLSADMASFYNISQERADIALKAVYTGETEVLKQYGIVMTEVNLQQYALSQGITKSLDSMNQQEKTMLRYNYVLQQTQLAQGDFVRTSDSWANQTRILSENWKQFMTIVGNGLVKVLTPLVIVLNKIVSGLISFANAIASVFGGQKLDAKETSEAISSSVENQEALTDATKKTNKEAKKTTASFDEIQKIQEQTLASGSGASGVGGAGGMTIPDFEIQKVEDATAQIDGIVKKIEALKYYLSDLFSPLTESFRNKLMPALYDFSKEIQATFQVLVDTVSPIFNKIWSQGMEPALRKIVKIWAEMVTAISDAWEKWGEPIFVSLRSAIEGAGKVFETMWNNFIKPVLDNFMQNIDWLWDKHLQPFVTNFLDFIGFLIKGALDIYNGFILPVANWFWGTFGETISNSINTAIDVIFTVVGAIADVASGIITSLKGVVEYVAGVFTGDWERAWEGIKKFHQGIWNAMGGIVKGVVNLIIDYINGMLKAIETGVNKVIGMINKLEITNPFTGDEIWSPNISTVSFPQIPKLAQGAVIPPNKEFMAILGDQKQGVNIETPLSTMIEAFKQAQSQQTGELVADITLDIDGEKLYNQQQRIQLRRGTRLVTGGAF